MNQSRRDDIIFLIKYLGKLLDKDLDARLSEFDLTEIWKLNENDK